MPGTPAISTAASPTSVTPTRPARGFTLSGPSGKCDPRTTPVRGDLADIALAGRFFVPHYAEPLIRNVVVPFAPLRPAPKSDATAVSELLAGEQFRVLDIAGGWAWGACAHDGYLGYLPVDCIGDSASNVDVAPENPVQAAKRFLGQPYAPGGRGGAGFDSAGLIQRAFAAHHLPRDADQLAAFGSPVSTAQLAPGDLLFRDGSCGIYAGSDQVIHADQTAGAVVQQDLATFAHGADIIARRISP